MLAPDLFSDIDPPAVFVRLHRLHAPYADDRLLDITLTPPRGKSIHVDIVISRYAPENTVFMAVSYMIAELATCQMPIGRKTVKEALERAVGDWVSPF